MFKPGHDKVEEVLLEGLAEPLIVPPMEGREGLGGGAMDVWGPFEGGSMNFLAVPDGVLVLVELPEEVVEPSCFVGDLLGDCEPSATSCPGIVVSYISHA